MEIAILQLILTKGVGEAKIRRFCERVQSGKSVIPASGVEDISSLIRDFGFTNEVAREIVCQRLSAVDLLSRLKRQGVSFIWLGHRDFPENVVAVLGRKAPPVLFLKGNRELLRSSGVGFCGSRKASARGLGIARKCAELVAMAGYSVVSGNAVGVDENAHGAAMQVSGNTIMVLAEGILRSYEKASLHGSENPRNHLYVSQFPPDCAWFAHNAMRRNELILGLSKAMIVIEAGLTGGSLAAGESSLSYGEPLYVVEYKSVPQTALGNEVLLKKGASPIRTSDEGAPMLTSLLENLKRPSLRAQTCVQMDLF